MNKLFTLGTTLYMHFKEVDPSAVSSYVKKRTKRPLMWLFDLFYPRRFSPTLSSKSYVPMQCGTFYVENTTKPTAVILSF